MYGDTPARGERDLLEAHEDTLALNVREAHVHAARIAALGVPIEHHVLHARHDALHEPLREPLHVSQVVLRAANKKPNNSSYTSILLAYSYEYALSTLLERATRV